jgi:two-component system response regulator FixJ
MPSTGRGRLNIIRQQSTQGGMTRDDLQEGRIMSSQWHLHVIDPDVRRRARIAFELREMHVHNEIYESIEEFVSGGRSADAVLLFDEAEADGSEDLTRLLDPASGNVPVALYSEAPMPERIVDVLRGGAVDYLVWPFARDLLKSAMNRLRDEEVQRELRRRRELSAKTALESLSDRETDVLELMMFGDSNKEIAQRLGISPRTVEIHRGNMMRKLKARSSTDAVRIGLLAGLDGADEESLAA